MTAPRPRVGRRVLVVQHQDDCPPALVGEWLVEAGCELDVRRPYAGDELPGDLSDHDSLLVLGGSMGAGDEEDHPWLAPTKALVRQAAERRVPTLGICLGHQVIATALGGSVTRNPRGQQLGLLQIGWTDSAERDELAAGLLETRFGVHWNDDVVVELPLGAVVLATAPGGEVQVARFARTVWGVQLHPEVDDAILRVWAQEDPDRYAERELADVLARISAARDQLEAGWRPLALSFAALP